MSRGELSREDKPPDVCVVCALTRTTLIKKPASTTMCFISQNYPIFTNNLSETGRSGPINRWHGTWVSEVGRGSSSCLAAAFPGYGGRNPLKKGKTLHNNPAIWYNSYQKARM